MKKFKILVLLITLSTYVIAQESEDANSNPLVLSGSVDVYYKSDFSGNSNIGTSFASDHNSFSIGMFNLIASKTIGKASFVADIGMGPRNAASVGPSATEFQPGIQNLYVSYALTEKVSVTAGYMGTFVGYEVISPTGNFNYSTSYLFTNGPFQNAGLKFDIALSDKVSFMAGVFNDWNVYNQPVGTNITSFGSQLGLSPVEGMDFFVNFITGGSDGMELDLTGGYQISDQLYLGVNAATWNYKDPETAVVSTFTGGALYLQYSLSDSFSLGVRGEQFSTENTGYIGFDINDVEATSVSALTFSANIGSGALKFIPEVRFDRASGNVFMDSSDSSTNQAAQFLVAAVFGF